MEFARENRQLITGGHQNIDKLLEESDLATRLATVEGNHLNTNKFLKVNQNTLAIAENQRALAEIRECLGC